MTAVWESIHQIVTAKDTNETFNPPRGAHCPLGHGATQGHGKNQATQGHGASYSLKAPRCDPGAPV
jgi:hypothetical protein